MISTLNLTTKASAVRRLTRWQEHVPTNIPLTILGGILAVRVQPAATLDWRLIVVALANCLVVAYAFMINDIEDAPDDAREAARAARNPVSSGQITAREGWFASGGVALLALALFLSAGVWPFVIGCLTLALSHLYSWKVIRLKAYPITDFVSHSLMLSGLLFLAGYFTYDHTPGTVWFVALAVTFVSCYGQLYNQLRDFEMDKLAGLNNTAILVGKRNARILMYAFIGMAVALGLASLAAGVIPLWVVLFVMVAAPLVFFAIRSRLDPRGTNHADASGAVQWQFIIIANAVTVAWLVATMVGFRG